MTRYAPIFIYIYNPYTHTESVSWLQTKHTRTHIKTIDSNNHGDWSIIPSRGRHARQTGIQDNHTEFIPRGWKIHTELTTSWISTPKYPVNTKWLPAGDSDDKNRGLKSSHMTKIGQQHQNHHYSYTTMTHLLSPRLTKYEYIHKLNEYPHTTKETHI